MFVVSKPSSTSFGTGFFATSSSCQREYNGNRESDVQQKSSIAGLKGSLRRNSSNLSQDFSTNLQNEICHADATNIEINCSSSARRAFYVRVEVPTGEQGLIHLSSSSTTEIFTPLQTGCGHGKWKFIVCTMENGSEIAHSNVSRNLDGVGILFFNVFDDLEICLTRQEFLHISHCHTMRH
ncbi:MATH domain-containing protein [Caenorhabditis elegans]|uniref:MATH domain-containing protein n=1 Tax=Caenorhabditis elegans TaxID=6239 RepID=O45423_CAEEL|nr:MATH domain-containing protein [Caenorhabditis elegans]CAB07376.1 MATH domain-containing protein [Caenorhabditis elegans]|eukprot:NP_508032.1 Uncharacterized protein CELE_F31D4.8 [Caenorhabditis elegans]